jgi:prefoldin subunit 5
MATLKIDDNEYEIDDLPEAVKAKVARMQEIQAQINSLNLQANELQTVFQAYINTIKEDLEPPPDE